MVAILAYLALGACAGLLAGLFGIGGGLIIVPALVFGFQAQGISETVLTHLAVGTSLATIVFTAISSVRAHHEKGGVRWEIFRPMAAGIVIGAGIGVVTTVSIPGPMLRQIIGIFALVVAAQMAFNLQPKAAGKVPGVVGLGAAGSFIGWASSIFGIGGGTLTVPFLTWCRVRMQEAVGTSAACGVPIALSAAAFNILVGWGEPDLPPYATGFVYWPAFAGIVLLSIPFARVGARLAHRLSPVVLKRTFSLLLVAVGLQFLLG